MCIRDRHRDVAFVARPAGFTGRRARIAGTEQEDVYKRQEFGTVKDRDQFQALYAYSPYHHVKDGTAYPAVLFLTGENDHRVNPLHSRKMTARLQAASGSDRPILLRTSSNSGHGIGTALDERIEEGADTISFLLAQLGIKYRP